MARTLTLMFRRDPSKDRLEEKIPFEGYNILWPDGTAAELAIDALCKHGQRLLGLGKYLQGCNEKMIDMKFFPLKGKDDPLTRILGHRVRRFYLHKLDNSGRVHFFDGTPTSVVTVIGRDEIEVVNWLGLGTMTENEIQWFDLAATPSEADFRVELDEVKEATPLADVKSYVETTWDKTLAESSWQRR